MSNPFTRLESATSSPDRRMSEFEANVKIIQERLAIQFEENIRKVVLSKIEYAKGMMPILKTLISHRDALKSGSKRRLNSTEATKYLHMLEKFNPRLMICNVVPPSVEVYDPAGKKIRIYPDAPIVPYKEIEMLIRAVSPLYQVYGYTDTFVRISAYEESNFADIAYDDLDQDELHELQASNLISGVYVVTTDVTDTKTGRTTRCARAIASTPRSGSGEPFTLRMRVGNGVYDHLMNS